MKMKSTHSGIGFIEVMTATVIISIACVGLLMGVVHARGELHSLEIKERATEELLNYMEYWKGRQYSAYRDGVRDRLSTSIVTYFDASTTGTSSTAQYSFQTSDRSIVARCAMRAIAI